MLDGSIPYSLQPPPVSQFHLLFGAKVLETQTEAFILVSNLFGLCWSQLVLTPLVFTSETFMFTFVSPPSLLRGRGAGRYRNVIMGRTSLHNSCTCNTILQKGLSGGLSNKQKSAPGFTSTTR